MIVYRSMTPGPDGRPLVGSSARMLGVRREEVEFGPGDLVLRGGMSVSPGTPWNLPPHRRPKRLGRASTGPDRDDVFEASSEVFPPFELTLVHDAADHALVCASDPCTFETLSGRLASSRDEWRVWPSEGANE